jgi:hypothetical protein
MEETCWAFLVTEELVKHSGEGCSRGQTRLPSVCIHISKLPVWRRRNGRWHCFVHVHLLSHSGNDCKDIFLEMFDELLAGGHMEFEHVPRPVVSVVSPGTLDFSSGTLEVRPEVLTELDFKPETASGCPDDDCGEPVELLPEAMNAPDDTPKVETVGDDSARVHAQRIGTRDVFEIVDPYIYSRYYPGEAWVAMFFTKYRKSEGEAPPEEAELPRYCRWRTPPVEYRCYAHISICKCKISKMELDLAISRAKHVLDSLQAKASKGQRQLRGTATYNAEYSRENYAWADIHVQSPLHQTCFAVLHAISPSWPRVNFHASFDTRPHPHPAPIGCSAAGVG